MSRMRDKYGIARGVCRSALPGNPDTSGYEASSFATRSTLPRPLAAREGGRRRSALLERGGTRRGFTLVELLVVTVIIGILLGMIVPGIASIWAQRNEANTQNMLRGLLVSARTRAVRTGARGLFFWLDNTGTQRVAFLRAEPPDTVANMSGVTRNIDQWNDADDCPAANPDCVTERSAVNRFRVMAADVYTIPRPYRVAPLWATENAGASSLQPANWPVQLEDSRRFYGDAAGADTPRYHRNFFAVVFSSDGELLPMRDVIVHDPDLDNDNLGDVTGLHVGDASQMWTMDSSGARSRVDIDPVTKNGLFDIVVLDDLRAADFISVDGLVVYDDSDVVGLLGDEIAGLLRRTGQPFYVSRYTGDVIMGPRQTGS